ncbi:MAG: hypothetical protein KGS44_01050 [Alphaproteobacteria bacterium]|nr:hypothetical protein [Alphaproteobacteria bacterium]
MPTSMPAVTPPPVQNLPSKTMRAGSGMAPKAAKWSRTAQKAAARGPFNRPAAPRFNEPVQTLTTHFALAVRLADKGQCRGVAHRV